MFSPINGRERDGKLSNPFIDAARREAWWVGVLAFIGLVFFVLAAALISWDAAGVLLALLVHLADHKVSDLKSVLDYGGQSNDDNFIRVVERFSPLANHLSRALIALYILSAAAVLFGLFRSANPEWWSALQHL